MMKGKYSIIFVLSQIIGPFFQKEVHKSAYVRGNFDKFAEKCKKTPFGVMILHAYLYKE